MNVRRLGAGVALTDEQKDEILRNGFRDPDEITDAEFWYLLARGPALPFETPPFKQYVKAPHHRVMFDRIPTPKFMKDVEDGKTYDMDVTSILEGKSS